MPTPGDISRIDTEYVTHDVLWLTWSPAVYAVSYTVTVSLNEKTVEVEKGVRGNSVSC